MDTRTADLAVSRTGATLAFQWAETAVPIRLEIQSSRPVMVAAHSWSSYAGVYELRRAGRREGTRRPL